MRNPFAIAIFLSAALSGSARAQAPAESASQAPTTQTVASTTAQPTFVNVIGVSNDYQVGPGDVLEIKVLEHTDFDQTLRISSSGEISYPMLGLIRVADLTAFEVEDLIATRLRDKGLIQQAEVLATVTEYHAKPIYVSGAVFTPGEFVMSQELTVADALLLAGGLRFNAADEALLYRRTSAQSGSGTEGAPSSDSQVVKIDLKPFKEGRFLDTSISMRRGDALVVPDRQTSPFYVVGEVFTPQNYFFVPGQPLMVSQAISQAGGPTPTAKLSDILIVRYDSEGKRQDVHINFEDVLRGTQKDVVVQAHDVIFVPGSKVKTITHGMALLTDEYVVSEAFRVGRRMQLPESPGSEER